MLRILQIVILPIFSKIDIWRSSLSRVNSESLLMKYLSYDIHSINYYIDKNKLHNINQICVVLCQQIYL